MSDARRSRGYARCVTPADPVQSTSGGGYAFEDAVRAWLAAAVLAGQAPFGTDVGAPVRIDFQVSVDGWRLDDVLIAESLRRSQRSRSTVETLPSRCRKTSFTRPLPGA